jgi:hypothetical protein
MVKQLKIFHSIKILNQLSCIFFSKIKRNKMKKIIMVSSLFLALSGLAYTQTTPQNNQKKTNSKTMTHKSKMGKTHRSNMSKDSTTVTHKKHS